MTIHFFSKRTALAIALFLNAPLCSMSCEEYLNCVNVLEQPITHINAIMRKYHQYERPHSSDETKKDILALQAICAASTSLTREQQQTITDEVLGLSLFILFFAHPFNQTSAYIDALLSAIKPTAAYLAVPPSFDANVRECDFCNMATAHWHTLAPHEQLVIKQIAAIPNASFYFAIPFPLTPSKLVRRLILFLCYVNATHDISFQSLNTFKDFMQKYAIQIHPDRGGNPYNPWHFFYNQLEQDPRLDYILLDDLKSLYDTSKNHLRFYDSSNQDSYYTIASKDHPLISRERAFVTALVLSSSYLNFLLHGNSHSLANLRNVHLLTKPTVEELITSTDHLNHLIAAAYLGAEKVFTELFDRYAPLLFDDQKLFYAAHFGGNASIKSMVKGIFEKEKITPWYTKSFYEQACRADNSVLAQHIKAYAWSNKIAPFYQPNESQIINDTWLANVDRHHIPNNIDEFMHIMNNPTISLNAKHNGDYARSELTESSIIAQATLPRITCFQNELSCIHFSQTNTPSLTQALNYIHKKIPFNNRSYTLNKHNLNAQEYDQQVIKNINAFFADHANNAQATSYMLDTLIGILIHDIFFITPYATIQEYVNTIITNIPRLNKACSLTTPSIRAYCKKMHRSLQTLQPYDALIINTLSPESINLLKYPLHAIILATKLSLCEHAPLPFYTLYDFKKFIQKLEITTLAPESFQNPFAYKNNIDSKFALEYELIFDLLSIPQKEYDTTLNLHEKLNKLQKTQYTSHAFFAGLIGDYEYFKTIHDQTSPLDQRNTIAAAIYGGNQECINLSLQSLEQGDSPSSQEIDNLFYDAIITGNYTLLMHLSHKGMQATTIQTTEPMQLIFCYNYFSRFIKKHHRTSLLHKHFFYAQQRHAYHALASLFAHLKKTPLLT